MRLVLVAAVAAVVAVPASAQLLGRHLSLPSTPSVPSVPSAPSLPNAPAVPSVSTPDVPAIDSARQTVDEATATARSVSGDVPTLPTVDVKAGVSTRVARGTRCHYGPDDSYYDAVQRDGHYYCEQRTTDAGASVSTPR